ncbi:MAG: hypothetical protein ACI4F3_13495 [Enterocloster sp.]
MKKKMKMKRYTAIALLIMSVLYLNGCTSKVSAQTLSGASSAASEELPEKNAVVNNGGTVVRYQGSDYCWRYSPDSFSRGGLFAQYSAEQNTRNQMVRIHPDGTEEVLFEDRGNGAVYILGDRMYLNYGYNNLYSVMPDGSDRVEYGAFSVWSSDDRAGTLLGYNTELYEIQLIDRSGNLHFLMDGKDVCYAGTEGEYSYCSLVDKETKELILYQIKTDGTKDPAEIDRYKLPADYADYTSALQVAELDGILYYSYGFYAGTGGYFQMGGINAVKLDGTDAYECVESGAIAGEEFQVENKNGAVRIYYVPAAGDVTGSCIGYWDDSAYGGCAVKNMASGATEASDFPLSRRGSFVYLDGAVSRMKENEAAYEELIPESLADSLGCNTISAAEDQEMVIIRNLEQLGKDIYFTVETGRREPSEDVGWRPFYVRESSSCYKMKSGEETAQMLYTY